MFNQRCTLLLLQLEFYCPTVAGNCVFTCSLGKVAVMKAKVAIHINSELQFPSEVSLAYITSVTMVLILLLLETFEWLRSVREVFPYLYFYKIF
jgi:hypothetical protein